MKNTSKFEFQTDVLKYGAPETIYFPFVPNGKLMVLGVPVFKPKISRI